MYVHRDLLDSLAEKCYKLWVCIVFLHLLIIFILSMAFYIIGTVQLGASARLKLQNALYTLIVIEKSAHVGLHTQRKFVFFFRFILWQLLLPDPNFCWEQLLCRFCSDLCVNTYLFPFYYFNGLPEARNLMVLCGEYNYVFIILRWRERKFYAVKQADQLGFSV